MPSTYIPIATQTISSNTSSVTFSSIPQIYTDLVLVVNAFENSNAPVYLRANGLSTSIYSNTWMRGDGTTATSSRYNTAALGGSGLNLDNFSAQPPFPSNFSGQATYNIMNYSNATTFKTVMLRHGSSNWTIANVGLIQTTSAITSLEIYPFSTTWAAGSTFSLYGIANAAIAGGPKATGGDTVVTDGTYWYHAFRASGTFTPTVALTADVLSVAGGGGGGYTTADFYSAAGGGAGGLVTASSQSLTTTGYSVTVGGGGAGGTSSGVGLGTKGSNSQFASLTAAVGGGAGAGAGGSAGTALDGGSGGGSVQLNAAGVATAGQGNNGGQGNQGGGGGGGAGAVGGSGSTPQGLGRPGGAGTNTYASWVNATGTGVSGFIAGGGGGGYTTYYLSSGDIVANGGSGGGGTGGADSSGTKALATGAGVRGTGSGGGGAGGYSSPGFSGSGAGGSGLVIVRYAV
jgi:hypothetical protein